MTEGQPVDMGSQWPFDQAPNVAAVTSTHITREGCPILLVTHYEEDHSWSFQSERSTRNSSCGPEVLVPGRRMR